jgi:Ca-activated chloride channel homolog
MKRALFVFFVLLVAVTSVAAQVVVPCEPPPCREFDCPAIECPPPTTPIIPGVFTNPEWLHIDYHRVDVTIDDQIATTNIDMQFTNTGDGLAEGTFLFPLPQGASVDQLTMFVNGTAVEGRILDADQARGIYDQIVRQYRDPALLEYVGSGAIQANVFPIPPNESRRIQISYTQVIEIDNGLFRYVYPLSNTQRLTQSMSVRVSVASDDPISSIYSPTHRVAINRADDNKSFTVGFEASSYVPDGDFVLYYGIASETISINLLSYRESASEDGFFLLLVQPPVTVDDAQVQPKDVILVVDQSGSMDGAKWQQAQEAAVYVLENLNPSDRFNVVLFSTGWRIYSETLQSTNQVEDAVSWIRSAEANGGTDIHGSLMTALEMVQPERPTTILFVTDGLATEGVTETAQILTNLQEAAPENARIFTFGVGDDVDTLLLDSIVQEFRGSGSYVRPTERVDEEVAGLYNRISSPVLTDIEIDFATQVELLYPAQMPDLFAGTQLTLVGRYRQPAENVTITLTGTLNGQQQTFTYSNVGYRANAGGEPFIARLWATRRIGELMNQIRLNGENQELVDSIIDLSVRYGIITPYTSFLIEEEDIFTQAGRDQAAAQFSEESAQRGASGGAAVDAADTAGNMAAAEAAPVAGFAGEGYSAGQSPIQTVGDKTFVLRDGVWTDTAFTPDSMTAQQVTFLSDEYFALLDLSPMMGDYLALGERVIVVVDQTAYEIVP